MNKSIWIIAIAILAVIIIFWIYMNRRIEEDINQQGEEVINELTLPLPEEGVTP